MIKIFKCQKYQKYFFKLLQKKKENCYENYTRDYQRFPKDTNEIFFNGKVLGYYKVIIPFVFEV